MNFLLPLIKVGLVKVGQSLLAWLSAELFKEMILDSIKEIFETFVIDSEEKAKETPTPNDDRRAALARKYLELLKKME